MNVTQRSALFALLALAHSAFNPFIARAESTDPKLPDEPGVEGWLPQSLGKAQENCRNFWSRELQGTGKTTSQAESFATGDYTFARYQGEGLECPSFYEIDRAGKPIVRGFTMTSNFLVVPKNVAEKDADGQPLTEARFFGKELGYAVIAEHSGGSSCCGALSVIDLKAGGKVLDQLVSSGEDFKPRDRDGDGIVEVEASDSFSFLPGATDMFWRGVFRWSDGGFVYVPELGQRETYSKDRLAEIAAKLKAEGGADGKDAVMLDGRPTAKEFYQAAIELSFSGRDRELEGFATEALHLSREGDRDALEELKTSLEEASNYKRARRSNDKKSKLRN